MKLNKNRVVATPPPAPHLRRLSHQHPPHPPPIPPTHTHTRIKHHGATLPSPPPLPSLPSRCPCGATTAAASAARCGALRSCAQWFLLYFSGSDSEIDLLTEHREFKAWKWMPLDEMPQKVVPFKRAVYEEVAARFGPMIADHVAARQRALRG